jgi:uncharacterized membrane protein
MLIIYVVHIVAGSLGLLAGYLALYAAKGATLHRKAGMVFVCAMLTMAVAGTTISALRGVAPKINIPIALLTAYLVITALTTVRPVPASRWLDPALMLLVWGVGLIELTFGFQALGSASKGNAVPFFIFGVVALVAAGGDARMTRSEPLRGVFRLARHLWRMCFALAIAALSFFIGQSKVFPKPIRIIPLLALPLLAVLVTMLYWLWRVRFRRNLHGILGINVPQRVKAHP